MEMNQVKLNPNQREMDLKDHTNSNEYMPSVRLRAFVQALLSPEVKGNKEEAAQISGVSRGNFYYALKNTKFVEWLKNETQSAVMAYLPATFYSVQQAAAKGDMKAALGLMEMAGLYKPPDSNKSQGTTVNVYPEKTIVFTSDTKELEDDKDFRRTKSIHAGQSASCN